jgi:hypothetical protein
VRDWLTCYGDGIFRPFTPQAAAGLSCAVTQKPRYDQRLNSALATTQPKAVTVTVCARQSAEPPLICRRLVPLCRWPFLQHPRSLPDREPRPRSLRNETLKDAPRLGEAVASEEHFLDPLSVPAPLFDLVRVSPVGIKWIISFFGGPVVGHR